MKDARSSIRKNVSRWHIEKFASTTTDTPAPSSRSRRSQTSSNAAPPRCCDQVRSDHPRAVKQRLLEIITAEHGEPQARTERPRHRGLAGGQRTADHH